MLDSYPRNRQPEPPVGLKFVLSVLVAATLLTASVGLATFVGAYAGMFHVKRALDAAAGRLAWDANGNPVVRR